MRGAGGCSAAIPAPPAERALADWRAADRPCLVLVGRVDAVVQGAGSSVVRRLGPQGAAHDVQGSGEQPAMATAFGQRRVPGPGRTVRELAGVRGPASRDPRRVRACGSASPVAPGRHGDARRPAWPGCGGLTALPAPRARPPAGSTDPQASAMKGDLRPLAASGLTPPRALGRGAGRDSAPCGSGVRRAAPRAGRRTGVRRRRCRLRGRDRGASRRS